MPSQTDRPQTPDDGALLGQVADAYDADNARLAARPTPGRLTDDELREIAAPGWVAHDESAGQAPNRWAETARQLAAELLELRRRLGRPGPARLNQLRSFASNPHPVPPAEVAAMARELIAADARIGELEADCDRIWHSGVAGSRLLEARGDRLLARATALEQHLATATEIAHGNSAALDRAIELGKPRRIDNPEDLDALPVGSVIIASGQARQSVARFVGDLGTETVLWQTAGGISARPSAYVLGAAGPSVTLVWQPPCYRCGGQHLSGTELCSTCTRAVFEDGELR